MTEEEWTPANGEKRENKDQEEESPRSARDRVIEIAQGYTLEIVQDDVTGEGFTVIRASDHAECIPMLGYLCCATVTQ